MEPSQLIPHLSSFQRIIWVVWDAIHIEIRKARLTTSKCWKEIFRYEIVIKFISRLAPKRVCVHDARTSCFCVKLCDLLIKMGKKSTRACGWRRYRGSNEQEKNMRTKRDWVPTICRYNYKRPFVLVPVDVMRLRLVFCVCVCGRLWRRRYIQIQSAFLFYRSLSGFDGHVMNTYDESARQF